MTVPRFKAGDIVRYPFANGKATYFLIINSDNNFHKVYDTLVLYENSFLHGEARVGTTRELSIETIDKFCTLEA